MSQDVKLLPLPELPRQVEGYSSDYWEAGQIEEYATDYARANMEPLLAENERLRAEVEKLRGVVVFANDGVADTITALDARAERLAEALRAAYRHLDPGALRVSHCKDLAKIDAALDQEGGNG